MSAAALTDSTTPAASPSLYVRPTSGRSTKTTSPSASCACSVMPTTAASWSSSWIHSCSSVYLTVMLLSPGGVKRVGIGEGLGSAAPIPRGNERHGGDFHCDRLAAHDRVNARSRG